MDLDLEKLRNDPSFASYELKGLKRQEANRLIDHFSTGVPIRSEDYFDLTGGFLKFSLHLLLQAQHIAQEDSTAFYDPNTISRKLLEQAAEKSEWINTESSYYLANLRRLLQNESSLIEAIQEIGKQWFVRCPDDIVANVVLTDKDELLEKIAPFGVIEGSANTGYTIPVKLPYGFLRPK